VDDFYLSWCSFWLRCCTLLIYREVIRNIHSFNIYTEKNHEKDSIKESIYWRSQGNIWFCYWWRALGKNWKGSQGLYHPQEENFRIEASDDLEGCLNHWKKVSTNCRGYYFRDGQAYHPIWGWDKKSFRFLLLLRKIIRGTPAKKDQTFDYSPDCLAKIYADRNHISYCSFQLPFLRSLQGSTSQSAVRKRHLV